MRFDPMPIPPPLPPQLAALAAPAPGALSPVTVRLDSAALAELERLRDLLNRPSRGALLRYVLRRGMAATAAELQGLD